MRARLFIVVLPLVVAMMWSSQAFSYSIASNISYDMPNETLSGYSQTRMDSSDVDWFAQCVAMYYDDILGGWECEYMLWWFYYVYAEQAVWSPTTSYSYDYTFDGSNALVGFANSLTTLYAGTWGEGGEHYAIADVYGLYCYYYCYDLQYIHTEWYYLGNTASATKVCASDVSVIDQAGIAFLRAWPHEPFESDMGIYCYTGDPQVELDYRNFYFSFGGLHATDDPCAVYGAGVAPDHAADMHTHPKFTNEGWREEMSR